MRRTYTSDVVPPAMVLRVTVSPIGTEYARGARAMLDTGAAISAIPDALRKRLKLAPGKPVSIRGASDTEWRIAPSYYVTIALGDWSFDAKVVSLPRNDVVVGRDVLNQLVLAADGPSLTFELTR